MGTRTPWATLLTQYADNTSGAITAERLRNFVQSARPHTAAADPTVTDDSAAGFDVGHGWLNTSTPALFECVNATVGAAVWVMVYPVPAHAHVLADITDAGTAAASDATDFATAAQGSAADAAFPAADARVPPTPVGQADGRMLATASDALVYVNAPTGGGGAIDLDDLTDVDTTGATDGDVLTYDTGVWVPQAPTGGGIAPASGILVVRHGATASTARPTAAVVLWQGSATPTNRVLGDFWHYHASAFD